MNAVCKSATIKRIIVLLFVLAKLFKKICCGFLAISSWAIMCSIAKKENFKEIANTVAAFYTFVIQKVVMHQGHPTICSAEYMFLWLSQLASKMNRSCEQIWHFWLPIQTRTISYAADLNKNQSLYEVINQEIAMLFLLSHIFLNQMKYVISK